MATSVLNLRPVKQQSPQAKLPKTGLFTDRELQEMLAEDLFAGRSVAAVIATVITIGFVLVAATVAICG